MIARFQNIFQYFLVVIVLLAGPLPLSQAQDFAMPSQEPAGLEDPCKLQGIEGGSWVLSNQFPFGNYDEEIAATSSIFGEFTDFEWNIIVALEPSIISDGLVILAVQYQQEDPLRKAEFFSRFTELNWTIECDGPVLGFPAWTGHTGELPL